MLEKGHLWPYQEIHPLSTLGTLKSSAPVGPGGALLSDHNQKQAHHPHLTVARTTLGLVLETWFSPPPTALQREQGSG